MKNTAKYIVLSLLFFSAYSCVEEFEPVFEQNASQRFQTAKTEYDTTLKDAPNGWLLQYFPHKERKYGGVNFYLKFAEQDTLRAMDETSNAWVESSYRIGQSGGVVLSFDTYNEILHKYAEPSSSEYQGKGGDYEFLMVADNGDFIKLKGRKTGNYMRLIKLKEKPEEYNKKVQEVKSVLEEASFAGKLGDLDIDVNKTSSKITFKYDDVEESIAYIYTDKGIYLYKPLKIGDKEFQEFILDKENKKLISEDGSMEIRLLYPPINFATTSWISVVALPDNVSEKVKEAWDKDAVKHLLRFPDKYELYPSFILGNGQFMLFIKLNDKPFPIPYSLNFKASTNPDNVIIERDAPGANWDFIGLNSTLNLLIGEFKVELDDKDNPTKAKLINVNDPDVWINLEKI